jgi:hypothetical protein
MSRRNRERRQGKGGELVRAVRRLWVMLLPFAKPEMAWPPASGLDVRCEPAGIHRAFQEALEGGHWTFLADSKNGHAFQVALAVALWWRGIGISQARKPLCGTAD